MFRSAQSRQDGNTAVAVAGAQVAPAAAKRPTGANPVVPIAPDREIAELALPPAAELLDEWRAAVARTTLSLRDRYPIQDATRGHAERLLVRLAVDLDIAVRHPSPAAQEALVLIEDPNSDVQSLVRVLERDAALCRCLIRHASSATFATGGDSATIDEAVRRLGGRGVQSAVLAGMAEGLLERTTGPYQAAAQQVWAHLARTGPRARAMARSFGLPAPEAFTIGLLHDVGKLVLLDIMSALREEVRREIVLPDGLGEDALQELHEPLGAITLLRWGLDAHVAWAVAHHHRRGELPEGRDARSELLFVCERLEAARTLGRPVDVPAWCEEGRLCTGPARVSAAIDAALAVGSAELVPAS